jgi:hypothetical protein
MSLQRRYPISVELIEPFPEMYWPLAWAWLDAARGQVADDFTPKTAGEFVEAKGTQFDARL